MLERQLEERTERRQRPLLVPGRRPDAELAFRRSQRVREHERALLGKPQRRLVAAPAVIKGDEAAGQLASRLDRLEIRLRNVPAPDEERPERGAVVAPHAD